MYLYELIDLNVAHLQRTRIEGFPFAHPLLQSTLRSIAFSNRFARLDKSFWRLVGIYFGKVRPGLGVAAI